MPLTVKEELRLVHDGKGWPIWGAQSTLIITLHPCTCTSLLCGSNFLVDSAKSEG